MKEKLHYLVYRYGELVMSAFMVGAAIAVWNPASIFFGLVAFHHLRHYWDTREEERMQLLIDTLFDQTSLDISCVEEIANRLVPFVGHDAVVEILKRHNIGWEKNWKNYTDKYPPRPKKKDKDRVSLTDWALKPAKEFTR